jgi:membrane AbrB-like protein
VTRPRLPRSLNWALALAIGALAGWICSLLRTPIPWMLGPLCTLAALRVAGTGLEAPPVARYLGQWVIGTSIGLYFTPMVIREVGAAWYLLAAGAAFAIVVGYLSGLVLARLAGIDRTTAIFACVPGGASEMMVLGERFGARVDRVVAAQSLRILIVVIVIPFAYQWLGVHGSDSYVPGARQFDPQGFVELMAATLVGCLVAQRLAAPNAFVLGSLFVAIPLTAAQIDLSSVPSVVSNAGQCLLGCALGSRFQPDFLRGAHRFVGAVVVTVLAAIALSAVAGVGLAWLSGRSAATLVLGTAPGGLAEMSITAKVLQLGVPIVTAFHVARIVVLLLATAPIFARLSRLAEKRRKRP